MTVDPTAGGTGSTDGTAGTGDRDTPAGRRIALVTGANKGIGLEIARQLGELGMTVIATARDETRGREAASKLAADGADVRFVRLDVTDEASVRAAADSVRDQFDRLDVLVNNAAIVNDRGRRPSEADLDQVRLTYETNVFGVIAVTNAMLPLLRRSDAPRIVNLSSELGSLSMAADPSSQPGKDEHSMLIAYNSSKSALNAITLLYANELRGAGILVNAVTPGYCATDLNGFSGVLTAAQGASVPVRAATLGTEGPTAAFISAGGTVPW